MKPKYIFTLVAAVLMLGTLVSRYANADRTDDVPLQCGDTGVHTRWKALRLDAVPVERLSGATGYGRGEAIALQRIATRLDRDATRMVGIEWTEQYRKWSVTMHAYYVPQEKALFCASGTKSAYVYQPVTRAGIATALRDGRDAPFASANLYSLPRVAER